MYTIYFKMDDGWHTMFETCESSDILDIMGTYQFTSLGVLFLYQGIYLPTTLSKAGGWNFDLDNVPRIELQSMFKGFADILIMPRQEILNGFKLDGIELSGYTRATAAS